MSSKPQAWTFRGRVQRDPPRLHRMDREATSGRTDGGRMSSAVQRPFVVPARPWRKPAPEWIKVEGASFPLPAECVLVGCRLPSAPGNAFCSFSHYREACKLAAHGSDAGRCGWTWSEP